MQPDLLQQLRDIHLPADPAWWPPAPGWWLLAGLALAAAWYLVGLLRARQARRRPLKEARALYHRLHEEFVSGRLTAVSYLHESNELLKRLVIFGLGDQRARRASDAAWLEILDHWAGSNEFTEGPGMVLGNQRFRPHPEADVDSLHPLLERFLQRQLQWQTREPTR